jgi:hypothetical protein
MYSVRNLPANQFKLLTREHRCNPLDKLGAVARLSAAPTVGTWVRGDWVFNSTPSSGGPPGWVCTAGGTPGTWKAMANLA